MMFDKFITPKLIILDCDGVLYSPEEFNINAIVYAFNNLCDELGLKDYKFNYIENCTRDKPVKGIYNYFDWVAKNVGLTTESFITKIIEHIDYSKLSLDTSGVWKKLMELKNRYRICICTNNHSDHVYHILKAKFNILPQQVPFEVFDMRFGECDGVFYQKDTPIFISKLEEHFGISLIDFLWIDDNLKIVRKMQASGGHAVLVDKQHSLLDILNTL